MYTLYSQSYTVILFIRLELCTRIVDVCATWRILKRIIFTIIRRCKKELANQILFVHDLTFVSNPRRIVTTISFLLYNRDLCKSRKFLLAVQRTATVTYKNFESTEVLHVEYDEILFLLVISNLYTFFSSQ